MNIEPAEVTETWLQWRVSTSPAEIEDLFGFPPNMPVDPTKADMGWTFAVQLSPHARTLVGAIWSWKGGYRICEFSAWGDRRIFEAIFGRKNVHNLF